jgi:radical SAM protein with 4Fe4S-binding SPASM domain
VKEVCLHFGGESLLHPKFKEYLEYAIHRRDNGGIQRVSWIDNGMLFDEAMSNLVVALKVDAIGFSIDGVGEVNDSIRLGAKYSVIERNIKYLLSKRGVKPEVFLSMCSFGKTDDQLMDVYRDWAPFVDRITLIPSIASDNSIDKAETYTKGSKLIKSPSFCNFPFELMAVSWDGKVTGCCLDYSFKLDLDDATQNSLKSIWHGSRYHALRNAALKNDFPPGPCKKCEFWKINFEPKSEEILDGKAVLTYGYIYKSVKKKAFN